ncbi:DJ-1/PfpI family protein [Natribacillus halophilus]|uniref:Protease I n=1 Tax=Natribacillus halophilus TaxID=549003 RepID=A0A1G8KQ07_9BACI|nr:DJ-1/PfpI family protein [Natribacillus halophilus]SDI45497.1 protease I [Natribacillus halophilus]
MAKILILTGDAVEALEVFYPYYRFLEAGMEADIAAPSVKTLYTVNHDFVEGYETFIEKPSYQLKNHIAFNDVNPSDYDGLIIPGGRAPEYVRMNQYVPNIVNHFFDENKPVGAICHAAQLLSAVTDGRLKGREMTAFTACKPEVEAAGAHFVHQKVYVDDKLVTGHAWDDLPGFMREFMRLVQ